MFAHTVGRTEVGFLADGSGIVTCGEDSFVRVFSTVDKDAEPRTLEHASQEAFSCLAVKVCC